MTTSRLSPIGALLRTALTCLAGVALPALAQHAHVNAGARTAATGSPLFFANGGAFDAASGYLVHLAPTRHPVYGPIFFGGGALTFTSLPALLDNGGPSLFAAQPGAHLVAVLETLAGPAGGALSFWDSFDGFFDATEITFTVPVGTSAGTHRFALSENDGSAGADPYGHIHGRKFSATLPGWYVLGIRLVDTGTNGPGGQPLHAPSDLTYFGFQAGVTIADVTPGEDRLRLRFGTEVDRTYFVESSPSLGADASWTTVAGPVAGTGRLESVEVAGVPGAVAFHRLRVE
jgi:hypothetical protein